MFAILEGAVADLATQAGVVVQGDDIAQVDLVGVGVEMVIAEGLKPLQRRIDVCLVVMKALKTLSLETVARRAVMA